MKNIFYPKTKLFPHHPQVLHQLALQLFLMAEKFEHIFTEEPMSHGIVMPRGSYFDTGLMQAAGYRYRLQAIKPKKLVVLVPVEATEKYSLIGCSYESLHTFFGELLVDANIYGILSDIVIDDTLFEKYADPLVGQLPFIRSYHKIETISPLIVNKKSPTLSRESIRTAIWDSTGETGYIICTNSNSDEDLEKIAMAYQAATSQQLMTFGPEQKIA